MSKATRIPRELPAPPGKLLDLKLGYHLLRDRRVPLLTKALAIAIGFAVFALLGLIEFPMEEIAVVIPFVGLLGDVALDGLEAVYVPLLIACLLLPHLAPSTIIHQIRRELDPTPPPAPETHGPVIDI